MQSISVFLDITKVADISGEKFWCQQNHVSRDSYISGSSVGKV